MEMNRRKIGDAGHQKPGLAIILIAVLALIQVVRIGAFQLAQDVFAGHEAVAWLYPAFVDIFIGITAPFVAFAIWRKTGLAVWVTAIVWFTLSIFDHLDALTTALNVTGPLPGSFPAGSLSGAVTFLLVASALEAMALVWLTRGKMKSHYLGSLSPTSQ